LIKIIKLALPIAAANLASLLTVLINIKILASASSNNLYLLSLFMPLNFWIIALGECLRVAAYKLASTHCYSATFQAQLNSLLLVGLLGILIPLLIINCIPELLIKTFAISSSADIKLFKNFVNCMFLSGIFQVFFSLACAILSSREKAILSLRVSFFAMVLCVLLNFIFAKFFKLNIFSLPAAVALTYGLLLAIMGQSYVIKNFRLNKLLRFDFSIIAQVALPVWLTYLILILGLICFNHWLAGYGVDAVVGFGLAYRIQTMIILPALSLGVAVGIILNKNTLATKNHKIKILLNGLQCCVLIYLPIIFIIKYSASYWIGLLAGDQYVIQSAINYLSIVSFSYLGLAIVIYCCIVLDHIGYALLSASYSALIVILEILMAVLFLNYFYHEQALYQAIAVGNILSALICLAVIFYQYSKRVYV
jgi:Na+-driven multidrug efflux pump